MVVFSCASHVELVRLGCALTDVVPFFVTALHASYSVHITDLCAPRAYVPSTRCVLNGVVVEFGRVHSTATDGVHTAATIGVHNAATVVGVIRILMQNSR